MPDLERLRDDPGYFAHALGLDLTPPQIELATIHKRSARETAALAPRRGGKTKTTAVTALGHLLRHPGETAVVISASEGRARDLLATARQLATRSPLLASSVTTEGAYRLDLTTGSTLRCVAATDAAVRGLTASLVIADEAAQIPDSILLGAARPIIASEPNGRFVMVSSALRASGAFFDAVRRAEAGSENVHLVRWGLDDCPWILPSEIEAARESLGDVLFRAEYLGEFASGRDALFDRAMIEAVLVDYELTPLGELTGPARFAAAVDWGQKRDRTVVTAVGRVPGTARYGIASQKRWPMGWPPTRSVDEIADSPAHLAWLVSETNGLGGPLTDELFRKILARSPHDGGGRRPRYVLIEEQPWAWNDEPFKVTRGAQLPGFETKKIPLATTAASKAAAYSALRLLIERKRLVIPAAAEQLVKELLTLRVDLSATGTERIEAAADDCADSLAFALLPYRPRGRQAWRVRLAELADPRARIPAPELPPGAVRVPTFDDTGRGRPAWQSIGGGQLTVPEGVDLSEPIDDDGMQAEIREAMKRRQKGVIA